MALRFRRRGNGIQVLRVTSAPNSDKFITSPIGSLPLIGEKIPDSLLNVVSSEENSEIISYIEDRNKIHLLKTKLAALDLQQTINEAGQYLLELKNPDERDILINNFKDCLANLRSILLQVKKQG
jgi:hypothetical protein